MIVQDIFINKINYLDLLYMLTLGTIMSIFIGSLLTRTCLHSWGSMTLRSFILM